MEVAAMGYALAKEQRAFVERLVSKGKFNNQSEVVREALRRMERQETDYLNPPPFTKAEEALAFAPDPVKDAEERAFGEAVWKSIQARARQARS
jgi:putative addiction module CopG family antidote